ncbi:MAG: hypothetical protein ACRCST_00805 [Turicibacter sp.]
MDWTHVTSEVELRKLGSYQVIKNQIMYDVEGLIKIKSRGWSELYDQVVALQELAYHILEPEIKELNVFRSEVSKAELITKPDYFNSQEDAYIFYLLELEGSARTKKLGINKSFYHHEERAKQWYREIVRVIHPDVCHHPKAELAMLNLNELYKKMVSSTT